jgi:hypothetical protein
MEKTVKYCLGKKVGCKTTYIKRSYLFKLCICYMLVRIIYIEPQSNIDIQHNSLCGWLFADCEISGDFKLFFVPFSI